MEREEGRGKKAFFYNFTRHGQLFHRIFRTENLGAKNSHRTATVWM
jgi:hypothetical protein